MEFAQDELGGNPAGVGVAGEEEEGAVVVGGGGGCGGGGGGGGTRGDGCEGVGRLVGLVVVLMVMG